MNSVVWIYLAACFPIIWAKPSSLLPPLPVNPGGIGGLFRGPNLETIIKGPDGSEIISEQLGGAVQTETRLDPIVVPDQVAVSSVSIAPPVVIASPAPIGIAAGAISSSVSSVGSIQEPIPLVASPTPIAVVPQRELQLPIAATGVAVAAPVVAVEEPHIIETELVDAPEIEPDQSSDLKGPSGTISVRGSSSIVSGPASTTISEPVRKIPIAPVAIQPIAVQPQAIPVEVPVPATILTAPAPLNVAPSASTPLISLTGTSGAGIADAAVQTNLLPVPSPILQTPVITADQSNQLATGINSYGGVNLNQQPLSLTSSNAVDLGQTVISSTTHSPLPSSADIDVSRINLGQGTSLQNIASSASGLSSTLTPLLAQNIVSSTTGVPLLTAPSQLNNNVPNGQLLIPSASLPVDINTASRLDGRIDLQQQTLLTNQPNGRLLIPPASLPVDVDAAAKLDGRIDLLQDQALLTNQVVSSTPGYTSVDSRDVISPSQIPNLVNQQRNIISSTSLPHLAVENNYQNLPPVASVLDTVLVQPTDPRNREIIEFGGRQLENVGNIVPVVRGPVLVTGSLNDVQHIPTASISQLSSSRNELTGNLNGRYGRETVKNKANE